MACAYLGLVWLISLELGLNCALVPRRSSKVATVLTATTVRVVCRN